MPHGAIHHVPVLARRDLDDVTVGIGVSGESGGGGDAAYGAIRTEIAFRNQWKVEVLTIDMSLV